jgi:hypothetical protein
VLCEAGTSQALRLRLMLLSVTLAQHEACQDERDGNLHSRQQLRRPASSAWRSQPARIALFWCSVSSTLAAATCDAKEASRMTTARTVVSESRASHLVPALVVVSGAKDHIGVWMKDIADLFCCSGDF